MSEIVLGEMGFERRDRKGAYGEVALFLQSDEVFNRFFDRQRGVNTSNLQNRAKRSDQDDGGRRIWLFCSPGKCRPFSCHPKRRESSSCLLSGCPCYFIPA